VRPP
jgi:hypothetical protein